MSRFPFPKRPGEEVVLTWEVTRLPAGVTPAAVLAVTCAAYRGEDAAAAACIDGVAGLSGNDVMQRFVAGVAGVDYLVVFRVRLSDGQIRENAAILEVRTLV